MDDDLNNLEAQLESLIESRKKLRQELESLKLQFTQANQENESLRLQLTRVSQERAILSKQNEDASTQIKRIISHLKEEIND